MPKEKRFGRSKASFYRQISKNTDAFLNNLDLSLEPEHLTGQETVNNVVNRELGEPPCHQLSTDSFEIPTTASFNNPFETPHTRIPTRHQHFHENSLDYDYQGQICKVNEQPDIQMGISGWAIECKIPCLSVGKLLRV